MSQPTPNQRVNEISFRVRYAETDAMGIVHHSRYLPWLELGRTEWMRVAGLTYEAFTRMGYYLTVVEVGVRYFQPAHYDDMITVRTWLGVVQSRALRIEYEVLNEAGDKLARGFTRHVCITHDGKPARLPEALLRLNDETIPLA